MSVFNDAPRAKLAIESIRSQTWNEWECVVVNDGSTDGTPAMLDRLAELEPRLRVIHQSNTGLTKALIRGCAEARGDFIARQDSDDVSHPDRLRKQLGLLQSDPRIGFVSCWTQYIGPEGEPLEVLKRPDDPVEATRRLLDEREGPPAHGSVMFRRSLYEEVGGYREEFYYGQDSDLWLRMAEQSLIAYVPETLYQWRRDFGAISGAMRPRQKRFGEFGQACRAARRTGESETPHLLAAAEFTREIQGGQSLKPSTSADGGKQMSYLIGSRLAQDGDPRARRYLWEVLRAKPWHWKAWVRLAQLQVRSWLRSPSQARNP